MIVPNQLGIAGSRGGSRARPPQQGRWRACALTSALVAAFVAAPATADIVQGTVVPADAKVLVKNAAGEQVAELGGGPFQLRLPAGRFTAECTQPAKKTVNVFSLAQPTTVNINCS